MLFFLSMRKKYFRTQSMRTSKCLMPFKHFIHQRLECPSLPIRERNLTEPNFGRTKHLYLWVNGEYRMNYVMHINPNQHKSWNSILEHITAIVKPKFGAVWNLINLETKERPMSFDQLENNGNYVLVGWRGHLKQKEPYRVDSMTRKNPPFLIYRDQLETDSFLQTTENRQLTVIYLYANGRQSMPLKIVLTKRDLDNWPATLTFMSEMLDLPKGIDLLCSLDGQPVCYPNEIQHGRAYVAVPHLERFQKLDYRKMFFEVPPKEIYHVPSQNLKRNITVCPTTPKWVRDSRIGCMKSEAGKQKGKGASSSRNQRPSGAKTAGRGKGHPSASDKNQVKKKPTATNGSKYGIKSATKTNSSTKAGLGSNSGGNTLPAQSTAVPGADSSKFAPQDSSAQSDLTVIKSSSRTTGHASELDFTSPEGQAESVTPVLQVVSSHKPVSNAGSVESHSKTEKNKSDSQELDKTSGSKSNVKQDSSKTVSHAGSVGSTSKYANINKSASQEQDKASDSDSSVTAPSYTLTHLVKPTSPETVSHAGSVESTSKNDNLNKSNSQEQDKTPDSESNIKTPSSHLDKSASSETLSHAGSVESSSKNAIINKSDSHEQGKQSGSKSSVKSPSDISLDLDKQSSLKTVSYTGSVESSSKTATINKSASHELDKQSGSKSGVKSPSHTSLDLDKQGSLKTVSHTGSVESGSKTDTNNKSALHEQGEQSGAKSALSHGDKVQSDHNRPSIVRASHDPLGEHKVLVIHPPNKNDADEEDDDDDDDNEETDTDEVTSVIDESQTISKKAEASTSEGATMMDESHLKNGSHDSGSWSDMSHRSNSNEVLINPVEEE